MSYAIDVNILLYASDSSSPLNAAAADFLASCIRGDDLLCLGWPTVMGYLRMSTHPAIFKSPLSQAEAERNIDSLLGLPHVRVLSEQDGFWEAYRTVAGALPVRGNLVPDAHLAALLRQHGVRIIYTHDRDFRKFGFLKVIDPLDRSGESVLPWPA